MAMKAAPNDATLCHMPGIAWSGNEAATLTCLSRQAQTLTRFEYT